MYHVTSSLNRESILEHGFDVRRMAAAPGIAGSPHPEVDGCFLCEALEDVNWFADVVNNTGGPVDVWEVNANGLDLVEGPDRYKYYRGTIPANRLRLIEMDR
jgi:hypothetical protein